MQVVAERIGHHDGTNAASSPGGDGGAGDVDVPGQGPGAATHDVFSKTMVVGAPHGLRVQNSGDHPKSSPHGPEKINDIKGVAIANMKFIMSPCTAGMFLGTSCHDLAFSIATRRWISTLAPQSANSRLTQLVSTTATLLTCPNADLAGFRRPWEDLFLTGWPLHSRRTAP
jgi:hypothetical protein